MRILLAEDDPMLGDGLRAGLGQQGFQVDWVRDGVAAERELASSDYAAAVLDLGLPLKDGIDNLLDHYPVSCDFDFSYGYILDPAWQTRSQEAQAFAIKHYINVVTDIQVQLVKRPQE